MTAPVDNRASTPIDTLHRKIRNMFRGHQIERFKLANEFGYICPGLFCFAFGFFFSCYISFFSTFARIPTSLLTAIFFHFPEYPTSLLMRRLLPIDSGSVLAIFAARKLVRTREGKGRERRGRGGSLRLAGNFPSFSSLQVELDKLFGKESTLYQLKKDKKKWRNSSQSGNLNIYPLFKFRVVVLFVMFSKAPEIQQQRILSEAACSSIEALARTHFRRIDVQ